MSGLKLIPVKGKKNFDYIFSHSRKFFVNAAGAIVCFKNRAEIVDNLNTETLVLQYAVTVRKKNCRKAVVRNRIKRLLRVALRELSAQENYKNMLINIKALVLVWNSTITHPGLINLKVVKQEIVKLMDKIILYSEPVIKEEK